MRRPVLGAPHARLPGPVQGVGLKQCTTSVRRVEEVRAGIFLLWAEAPAMPVDPGQFFMVGCGDGVFLRRPLSVHRTVPSSVA